MNKSIFIKCKCCCSVIEFNIDELDQLNISVWDDGALKTPLSKKERIRWCDHVMKTGNPWADHTILNKQNAKRIVKFLNNYLDHGKTNIGNKQDRT